MTYTYNGDDRVQSYTNVWGQTLTYTYNSNNQVTQRADSLGGTLTYVYDTKPADSEQFSGRGATGTVVRVDFGYNARSEQTTITWYSNLAGTAVVAKASTAMTVRQHVEHRQQERQRDGAECLHVQLRCSQPGESAADSSEVGTTVYSGTNTYTYNAASSCSTTARRRTPTTPTATGR